MQGATIRLAVIIASTREGRFGPTVADWFVDRATDHSTEVDVIDLADYTWPAIMRGDPTADLQEFCQRIGSAEAFTIVTCEYNHGYPASLKNAIDHAQEEWFAKPVGFVSYGGIAGGLRAVEQLRQVFAELHMVTVRDTVSFHNAHSQFDDSGQLSDPEPANAAAKVMLDRLLWWARALRDARAAHLYGS